MAPPASQRARGPRGAAVAAARRNKALPMDKRFTLPDTFVLVFSETGEIVEKSCVFLEAKK